MNMQQKLDVITKASNILIDGIIAMDMERVGQSFNILQALEHDGISIAQALKEVCAQRYEDDLSVIGAIAYHQPRGKTEIKEIVITAWNTNMVRFSYKARWDVESDVIERTYQIDEMETDYKVLPF